MHIIAPLLLHGAYFFEMAGERFVIPTEGNLERGIVALKGHVNSFRFAMKLVESLDWPVDMRAGMMKRAFNDVVGKLGSGVVFGVQQIGDAQLVALNLGRDGANQKFLSPSGRFTQFDASTTGDNWHEKAIDIPTNEAWTTLSGSIVDAVNGRVNQLHPYFLELTGLLEGSGDTPIKLVAEVGGTKVDIAKIQGSGEIVLQIGNDGISERWQVASDGPRSFSSGVRVAAPFSGYSFESVGGIAINNGADGAAAERAVGRLLQSISGMALVRR